jgi:hypothetical protein
MKTARYITRTIAAGGFSPIGVQGKHLAIVSVSASTIEMGIDDEAPQQIVQGLRIQVALGFQQVVLRNTGGAGSTVVLFVSDEPIDVLTGSLLGTIAASLASIDADMEILKPGTAKTVFPQTVIGLAGAATVIFAANANRKSGFVQADAANAGRVWLGVSNAVTQVQSWFELLPGATSPAIADTVAVWACSENGTETVRGYETT